MLKLLFLSVAIVVLSERLPLPSMGASAANIRGMSIRDIRDSAHTLILQSSDAVITGCNDTQQVHKDF